MNRFEEVHIGLCRVPRGQRVAIVRDGLTDAARDVPELERLRRTVGINELGALGIRQLAYALCLWAEREGLLDVLFPLEEIAGNGANE